MAQPRNAPNLNLLHVVLDEDADNSIRIAIAFHAGVWIETLECFACGLNRIEQLALRVGTICAIALVCQRKHDFPLRTIEQVGDEGNQPEAAQQIDRFEELVGQRASGKRVFEQLDDLCELGDSRVITREFVVIEFPELAYLLARVFFVQHAVGYTLRECQLVMGVQSNEQAQRPRTLGLP